MIKKYPTIFWSALSIWYDNGMINRFEPEIDKVNALSKWMKSLDEEYLKAIETNLSSISQDDLQTVCCGDEFEGMQLVNALSHELLNKIFDEEYLKPRGEKEAITIGSGWVVTDSKNSKFVCIDGSIFNHIELGSKVIMDKGTANNMLKLLQEGPDANIYTAKFVQFKIEIIGENLTKDF